MHTIAIDASLTSTGVAFRQGDKLVTQAIQCKTRSPMVRLNYLRTAIEVILDSIHPEIAVIEGYAMGVRGGRVFDIGEWGGVLKLAIWERQIPIILVPPRNLKLFTTGKGNADKAAMARAIQDQTGYSFRTDDETDAYALLLMGDAYADRRLLPRDRRHYRHVAIQGVTKLAGRL